MTYTLQIDQIFHYFFVFVRLGAMMMVLPGFGELFIPARIRLLFAFVLTLAITPVLELSFTGGRILSPEVLLIIVQETIIGLFIGTVARIMVNALQVTATIIGLQTSLSSAAMFNPSMGTQDTVISSLLMMGATAMIFVTDTHHLMLHSLVTSYQTFPVFKPFPMADISNHVIGTVAASFLLGVKFSFPIMIVATVLNVASGLLNRLMPQMHVFFLVMPLQILAGFMLIAVTVGYILSAFIEVFGNFMRNLGV